MMPFRTLSMILLGVLMMTSAQAFTLTSQDFTHNDKIPDLFTCHGKDVSPTLSWTGAPDKTQSFVLIMDDPDAPRGTWVHWVIYNIPASTSSFAQGKQAGIGGTNSWDKQTYGGPCPPSGTHHYQFTLYALDTMLTLPSPASLQQITEAMRPHILGSTQLIGLYP